MSSLRTRNPYGEAQPSYRIRDEDWPSRETALAIIAAVKLDLAGTATELERLSGVPEVMDVSARCYLVYGYPELAPGEVSKWLNEVFMRPRSRLMTTTPQGSRPRTGYTTTPSAEPSKPLPEVTYGFTNRA